MALPLCVHQVDPEERRGKGGEGKEEQGPRKNRKKTQRIKERREEGGG